MLSRLVLIWLLAIAVVGYFPASVLAADDIAISPPSFSLAVGPGKSVTDKIRLYNNTTIALKVKAEARNILPNGELGQVHTTVEDTNFPLARWLSVSPQSVVLPARSHRDFRFTIRVPAAAGGGGYFGAVTFVIDSAKPVEQSNITITQEISALVLLKVGGSAEYSAEIINFDTERGLYNTGPVKFITAIKNNGNVHFKAVGKITIYNPLGQKIEEITVPDTNVLPDAVRQIEASWQSKWLIGRYRAKVEVELSGADKDLRITSETVFWAFPYGIGLPTLAGLAAVIGTLVYFKKRKRLVRID